MAEEIKVFLLICFFIVVGTTLLFLVINLRKRYEHSKKIRIEKCALEDGSNPNEMKFRRVKYGGSHGNQGELITGKNNIFIHLPEMGEEGTVTYAYDEIVNIIVVEPGSAYIMDLNTAAVLANELTRVQLGLNVVISLLHSKDIVIGDLSHQDSYTLYEELSNKWSINREH